MQHVILNHGATVRPEVLFRSLGDPTRLRSLMLLLQEGELRVYELTEALGLSQPKISRHLAYLRGAGITEARREGTWVFYRISNGLPDWARQVLHSTLDGNRRDKTFIADRNRLKSISLA
ncbi:MAG: metalloregulator ArsR/SmtB family transcription factor [Halothiobacillaceae bacterium]